MQNYWSIWNCAIYQIIEILSSVILKVRIHDFSCNFLLKRKQIHRDLLLCTSESDVNQSEYWIVKPHTCHPYYGSLGNLSWSCHDRLAHLVACGENDANLRQEGTTDGRQSHTQASVSQQSYISKEYSSLRHRKTFSTIILLVFGLKSCF